jgi:LacI family transcriptional regulator
MLVESDIPFVLFDKGVEREGFFEVMINDYNVSKMAANHLVQKGCKRILALLGNSEMSISRKRAKGFSEEMKKVGFSNFEMCFVKDFEDGKLMVEEEFKKKEFDGLFVMSDELLAASSKFVYSKIKDGLELNVVAISDGFLPHLFDFKVDYFHHDGFLLGQKSAERMLAIMNDENSKMLPDFYLELEVTLKANA